MVHNYPVLIKTDKGAFFMVLFKDELYNHKLDYFKGKYPVLKNTQIRLTQDLGKSINPDTYGEERIGLYDESHNLIILLDCYATERGTSILAHEVAHALTWLVDHERGHGDLWKKWCDNIYYKTGIMANHSSSVYSNEAIGNPYAAYVKYCEKTSHYQLDKNNSAKIEPGDDDTVIYIKRHKARVRYWMNQFASSLLTRADNHDNTKLQEPEISLWRNMDKEPRYLYSEDPNSDYQQKLQRYRPVFELHYDHNRHHMEYFQRHNDEFGMDLLDMLEFICDQLLGYKFNVSYTKAMSECKRMEKKYGWVSEDPEVVHPIASLLEATIRNYFVTLGGTEADKKLQEIGKTNLDSLSETGNLVNLKA